MCASKTTSEKIYDLQVNKYVQVIMLTCYFDLMHIHCTLKYYYLLLLWATLLLIIQSTLKKNSCNVVRHLDNLDKYLQNTSSSKQVFEQFNKYAQVTLLQQIRISRIYK